MRAKMVFLAGLGIGYVLGTRAGRERYEQLVATARRVKDNPTVQETAGLVQARAGRLAHTGRDVITEKIGERISDTRLGHTRIAERLFGSEPYSPDKVGSERSHQRRNGASHG
ncbi:MAG: hypothetical protein WCA46_19705 [Actinocatenispora sp.]